MFKNNKIVFPGNLWMIFLLVIISIGCEEYWKLIDSEIVEEYLNLQMDRQKLVENHNRYISAINAASKSFEKTKNPDSLARLIAGEKRYIDDSPDWIKETNKFKLFIEDNEKRLRRVGINPDYQRDNLKAFIELMRRNNLNFQKNIKIQLFVLSQLPPRRKSTR